MGAFESMKQNNQNVLFATADANWNASDDQQKCFCRTKPNGIESVLLSNYQP